MDYSALLNRCAERSYLISMIPPEELVRIGYEAGMNAQSTVLDLCCGYGAMLKIWHEAFGVSGVGVDIVQEFISEGRARLGAAGVRAVDLQYGDVKKYRSRDKFDFVNCTTDFLDTAATDGIAQTLELMERFVKPGGKLIFNNRYAKTEHSPQALHDFEGITRTLPEINALLRGRGYFITAMASCNDSEWERYIMWSARRHLDALRKNPGDTKQRAWCDKWYDTYFGLRRQHVHSSSK